jgi:ABC-type transport system involved in multi-copper enzyme maturation permease subunit
MNTVFGLAGIVIKELYRRKDFYVLFVMTAVITLVMGSVTFFNDAKIARYLKEICLSLIWLSSLVIAIGTTARQIPAERENRTIFPLLAKPVTRWQVILGKFTGCWLACGLALAVFYLFFGVVSATREQHWPIAVFLQGMWLQWCMLAIVIALTLLGSIVFTAPSSNATICFVVVLGILLLGRHLNKVAMQQPEPASSLLYAAYYLIPHIEWFDLKDFIVFNHDPVGLLDCALATVYAAVYSALLLAGSWLLFRGKALNT